VTSERLSESAFRAGKPTQFKILEKDVIDEIIFRTQNPRNRLLLELMARGCMRVGEVLNLTPMERVLLRHSNLSTTQIYLGKVSYVEAIRWIDNLHG